MILLYLSIPLMMIGLALATAPLIWAMAAERRLQVAASERR
jgi:hypothetical protein